MYEERCNIKIHTFQAFDGDSFLVTICESEKEINYSSHYFSNYNWKKVVKLPVNTILKVECLP